MVFEDRVAKYPGRWTMVKSDGTSEVVTLVRNDEPSVEGTPINASTLNELSTVAGALNAAEEARESANLSREQASAAAESAESAASQATVAAASASAAQESESHVAASASAAESSAQEAAVSQAAAAQNQKDAESARDDALLHAQNTSDMEASVKEYAAAAQTSKTSAGLSAASAAESATAAAGSASAASESAAAAQDSQTAAKQSEDNAAASEANAKRYSEEAGAKVGTDKTLTTEDAPADAKAVGDALAGKLSENMLLDGADADTLLTSGIYHIKTQQANNMPTTNHGTLYVDADVETKFQIFIPDTPNTFYKRRYNNSTSAWSEWVNMVLVLYPVGSIYMSTSSTSPASLFGGTWEEIASERVLMGRSTTHKAGTTVEAGLPNITGSFVADVRSSQHAVSGAFSVGNVLVKCGYNDSDSYVYKFSFNASKSNSIYGKSTTVQPAAYYVYIWRRKA